MDLKHLMKLLLHEALKQLNEEKELVILYYFSILCVFCEASDAVLKLLISNIDFIVLDKRSLNVHMAELKEKKRLS